MSCRLLLVDDHEVVRKNLREIIEFKTDCLIVGEAVDGLQAVVLAKKFTPDIAVVDISMRDLTYWTNARGRSDTRQNSANRRSWIFAEIGRAEGPAVSN